MRGLGLIGCLVMLAALAPRLDQPIQDEPVQRVERAHAGAVADEDRILTRRPHERAEGAGEERLERAEAEADLDQLEWYLEDRYAYLTRRGVDYRRGLDSIRAALDDEIRVDDFTLQLGMLVMRFGDGHGRVRGVSRVLPRGQLPCRLTEVPEGVVAFTAGGRALVEGYPLLRRVDGIPIERWVEAAHALAPAAAPHFARRIAVERAVLVEMLRPMVDGPGGSFVEIELESTGGAETRAGSTRELAMRLSRARARERLQPMTRFRVLDGDVGYLRLPTFSHDVDPDHASTALEAMHAFRDTRGLVIDVRGNGGGSRFALRLLFPFFMKPDEPAWVANAAVYRRSGAFPPDHLAARFMHRRDDPGWSGRARAAIDAFVPAFEPEWMPADRDGYSDWHYLVLDRTDEFDTYPYGRPVVILMDGGCFSATDIFLGAFAGRPGVTLMGTPSGGGSGRSTSVTLANSGIQVRLSSMVSFRPDGRLYDGRGVEPDRHVPRTVSDVVGGTDTQLDAALAFIREANAR